MSFPSQYSERQEKLSCCGATRRFTPSLHFKCINQAERIWSVRITLGYRALGILDSETITWFWMGSHKDYERQF